MIKPIKVAVSGAGGRMGREVVKAVLSSGSESVLVGAADPKFAGQTIKECIGLDSDVLITDSLDSMFGFVKPDVVVDFSLPSAVMDNIRIIMRNGAVPVVGTTGITPENVEEIRSMSKDLGIGAIIAPNFAIGAVLMMKISAEVAKYLPSVEIIELHHDKKLDSPSGTSIKTAEMIDASRNEHLPSQMGAEAPARGAVYSNVHIHSVRLPGFVAHQEVIFGGLGQSLTIRHDSYDRTSFMPGVMLAVKKAAGLKEVIYGLENII